jgi:choline-sulfatase
MDTPNRRTFLKAGLPLAAQIAAGQPRRPNVLFVMADQFRFDAIGALGNRDVYTPNLDRLVKRGATFTNAYSPCPVCVPARYSIRTGCEPPTTRIFGNGVSQPLEGQPRTVDGRCGPYLAATMKRLGYRTFGVGKFHTSPWDEALGYDVHLHSEELYGTPEQRNGDSYARWIATEHAPFNYIEGLMGERTEMYYMPQARPMPAAIAVERWAADRAVEQIRKEGSEPYFGFVSFIGPHPPLAPPIPFNRLYDPDRMPNPVSGELEVDHMDEQIPWMNYAVWAEDVNDPHARVLRARYYGTITYIDDCIGRILDAVETRSDAANTLICFFSDHGDHLGDHHAWQKESFFEASAHVPFLVSWPEHIEAGATRDRLVSLTDLFGLATSAAGSPEWREGSDLFGTPREYLLSFYGEPGTRLYKVMVRHGSWKYIYMANGGREQLFNLQDDPHELRNVAKVKRDIASHLHAQVAKSTSRPSLRAAMDGDDLRAFPFAARPLQRIYQFDRSRGVRGFPQHPKDALAQWRS